MEIIENPTEYQSKSEKEQKPDIVSDRWFEFYANIWFSMFFASEWIVSRR